MSSTTTLVDEFDQVVAFRRSLHAGQFAQCELIDQPVCVVDVGIDAATIRFVRDHKIHSTPVPLGTLNTWKGEAAT